MLALNPVAKPSRLARSQQVDEGSRYSGVDVVLVKTKEEGAWGEFTGILREVRATGREAYFYHSDGPCECTQRDLVVHAGIRQNSFRSEVRH